MDNIIDWLRGYNDSALNALGTLWFFLSMLLVLVVAVKLVKYAEILIEKTKFGGAFVGGALIAAATSLPELITEIVQSADGHPGAGTADDIGSNAFSAFLIAIAVLMFLKTMFMKKVGRWTKISIGFSSLIAIVVSILMWFKKDLLIGSTETLYIGIIPMSLFIVYLIFLLVQWKFGDSDGETFISKEDEVISVKKASWLFLLYSILTAASAILLNWFATGLQKSYPKALEEGTVGGIFLAISTSLPEVVAFFAFLKKKQPIAAIAALVGSHIFNLGISFFGDIAYHKAPTFTEASVHANWSLAAITGIMMFLLLIHSLTAKYYKRKWTYAIAPSLAVGTYIIGWALILTNSLPL